MLLICLYEILDNNNNNAIATTSAVLYDFDEDIIPLKYMLV
tara:strand:- start:54195 stop:54317 length:123 start_codon:yes stop_codon:yes gene_type:complete